MTAFALDLRRDRIAIASDTMGYVPDTRAPLGLVSKILQLPQHRACLLGRGQYAVQTQAVRNLMTNPALLTIEDLAEELPIQLRNLCEEYADIIDVADHRDVLMLDCILCGWSESDKRMKAWMLNNTTDFEMNEDNGECYKTHAFPDMLPAEYWPRITGNRATERNLIDIIAGMRRYYQDTPSSGMVAGGEVALVEVTRAGMSHRIVHRFEDYQLVFNTAAAVRGRWERGDLDLVAAARGGLVATEDLHHIDQAAAEPVQLSRQQRRAAERAAKKGQRAA